VKVCGEGGAEERGGAAQGVNLAAAAAAECQAGKAAIQFLDQRDSICETTRLYYWPAKSHS